MKNYVFYIFMAIFAFKVDRAFSCETYSELNLHIFRSAEVILRAEIMDYRYNSVEKFADIKFKLKSTLKANFTPSSEIWEARWKHSTFSMPDFWNGPTDVIVGLRSSIDRSGVAIVDVVQQPCGPPSMIDDNPTNMRDLLNVIDDQIPRRG